jgi:tRNA-specific 2-thiouridylase
MDKGRKIAVGMSGGVDSSVAALLLREQGHQVVGLTLFMRDRATRCVGLEDVQRARKVAEKLGIEHHIVDARQAFEQLVVRHFADEYAAGRTPSPCVRCNPLIKFGLMLDHALKLGCDAIATGHYIRNECEADGLFHLRRGLDANKDQSYFLHRLTQQMLARARFPLGTMVKDDVRALANRRGVFAAGQSDSQDLCFVGDEGYIPFVKKYHPELAGTGHFVDGNGTILGQHEGFYRYTIGQRKGIGIAGEQPYYVKEIRAESNDVVIGVKDEVFSHSCRLVDVAWISGTAPANCRGLTVQVRYRSRPVAVEVAKQDSESWLLDLAEPQFAITPGQAAVFYRDDELLGGGWIS